MKSQIIEQNNKQQRNIQKYYPFPKIYSGTCIFRNYSHMPDVSLSKKTKIKDIQSLPSNKNPNEEEKIQSHSF